MVAEPTEPIFDSLSYYDMAVATTAIAWCALTAERTLPDLIDGIRSIGITTKNEV